jgi:hypothetical protein
MFNPFPPYETKYLAAFRQKGVKAFVMQTYDRGRNMLEENPRPAFLLTHYEKIDMAQDHMDAITHDPCRRLFLLDNSTDLKELERLGQKDSGEKVFLRFKIPNAEQVARKVLDKKLHAYIDYKLGWKIPGHEVVQFTLEFIFGEIYAVLRHGSKYHKVKIDEIETTKGYVL